MRISVIGLAGIVTTFVAWPSFAQVLGEDELRPPPPAVEREVIVREPAWRRFARTTAAW